MAARKTSKKKTSKTKRKTKQSSTPAKTVEPSIRIKRTPINWRPVFAWVVVVLTFGALIFFAFDYFLPDPNDLKDELVGTYGPFDVYKSNEYDYYMQINPEVVWHFRANPLDTVSIPVFPYKSNFKQALEGVNEVWIAFAAEEDPRMVVAAVEISKTLGAQGYTVKRGWLRQPKICETEFNNSVCTEPIIPLEFANENRTVFRMLGPIDNIHSAAIYAIGNNIIVQAPDYDQLDLAAEKAVLLMLGLA